MKLSESSTKDSFTLAVKIAYSFFLIHVPVGGKIINFSVNFVESSGLRIAIVISAFFASLLLSYIFYRLIELPAVNLSHLIIKRNKSLLDD
ncbi:MAG: hypothetical protein EOO96_00515 [Pedobacter sp.]|nr:MAG: hypothetical protein EOO96_00515 [Pedobacter sp.]